MIQTGKKIVLYWNFIYFVYIVYKMKEFNCSKYYEYKNKIRSGRDAKKLF